MSVVQEYRYDAEIIRTSDGVAFGRREVPQSDLQLVREQILFDSQRAGRVGADPNGVRVIDEPVFAPDGNGQISGVTMAIGEGDSRVEEQFGIGLFESFASSNAASLLQANQLSPEDQVSYRVYAQPADPAQASGGKTAKVYREPLKWSEGVLDDWLAAGQAEGSVHENDYPVFILEKVLDQAKALSWKGRENEGGCWLVGNLFRQVKPRHEIFAVFHTVLEAHGLKHDRFGLELSSETFVRFREQMERRRNRFGREGELETGFYHTHPFLPGELHGHDACTGCEKRGECNLSSASFLSKQDARFHLAMFGCSAPYAIELVLGLTAREEFDLQAFCLDGGQFRRRGFFRVPQPPHGALND